MAELAAGLHDVTAGLLPGRFDPEYPVPLAVGLYFDIIAELGLKEPEAVRLGALLRDWRGRPAYFRACAAPGSERHGVDGIAGPVSDADRAFAGAGLPRSINHDRSAPAVSARGGD